MSQRMVERAVVVVVGEGIYVRLERVALIPDE